MGPACNLLSSHGLVLVALARCGPALRLRDLAQQVGLTERQVFRVVAELEQAGLLIPHRFGNRNLYEIPPDAPLQHPLLVDVTLGDLLWKVLAKGVDLPLSQATNRW